MKQLEAALGLVLPRMAPGLLAGGVAAAAAAANGSNGGTEVWGVCVGRSDGWFGWVGRLGLGIWPGLGGLVGCCLVSLPQSCML